MFQLSYKDYVYKDKIENWLMFICLHSLAPICFLTPFNGKFCLCWLLYEQQPKKMKNSNNSDIINHIIRSIQWTRRLPFNFCINNNQGWRWIIFDNQGGGWVIRRLPFDVCIKNNQWGGWIIIIVIMLSLFTTLLDWIFCTTYKLYIWSIHT